MQKDPIHEARKVADAVQLQEIGTLNEHFQQNAAELNSGLDLEQLYPIVRPLLSWIEGFLCFKPEWQQAIGLLINTLDAEYPIAIPSKTKKGNGPDNKIPGLENE